MGASFESLNNDQFNQQARPESQVDLSSGRNFRYELSDVRIVASALHFPSLTPNSFQNLQALLF
jgi:hypothetical protein